MNYLLESTVCITIFYGLYYLIFRRLTFIRLNRIYLLSSLVVGLLCPLISYQIKEVVKIPARVEYEETSSIPLVMNSSTPLISNNPIEEPFDWKMVLQGIYVLGILFMLIKFSIIVYKLLKIRGIANGNDFISTQSKYANSSFFNLIFIDDSNLSENEINQILEHEKWHIRLFHSYDLLFVEILKIVFWFNPILWLYQRSLSEVHEYEVDTRMIQTHNPQNYAQLLLKLATATPQLATTHQFSRKPLTDRIHFLFTKQKSVPMKRLAYLSVLPILGAFFMAFSVEKVVDYQEVEESSKYFKIFRETPDYDDFGNVRIVNDKVVPALFLYKGRVAFTSGPNQLSEAMIIEVAKYFKTYGYTLSVLSKQYDVKKKNLEKIEIGLYDDKKEVRDRIIKENENYPENNERFNFNLVNMRIKLAGSIEGAITIIANRSAGVHFVAPLSPPPPLPARLLKAPPAPPRPSENLPPAPPKPPLPPVKVGMKSDKVGEIMIDNKTYFYSIHKKDTTIYNRFGVQVGKDGKPLTLKEAKKIGINIPLRSKENDILQATIKGVDMLEAMKLELTYKNHSVIFDGKKIESGKFLGKLVTQKNWQSFLDFINQDNYFSSGFRKKMIPDNWTKIKVKSDKIPVTFISYEQANEYCKWQSEMFSNTIPESQNPNYQAILISNAKVKLAFKCRLPTEKEWQIVVKKKMGENNSNEIGFRCVLETPSI